MEHPDDTVHVLDITFDTNYMELCLLCQAGQGYMAFSSVLWRIRDREKEKKERKRERVDESVSGRFEPTSPA